MSETAEPVDAVGYQRFDCAVAGPDQLAAATEAARAAIEDGACIVLPTDTVYGIGADAFSGEAVQRLLDAKQRGRDMPPPVLIGDASLIRALATDVPESAKELVAKHWPGPLTIICKIQPSLRMDLGDAEGTIALRVPDHEVAREVLRRTGPMAVSSANVSGRPAALTCDEAVAQLGDTVSVYLDAGTLGGATGAPSTIVDFTQHDEGEVLRLGALSLEVLRETLPELRELSAADDPESASESATAESDDADRGGESREGAASDDSTSQPEAGESWDASEAAADSDYTGDLDPNQPDLFAEPEDERKTAGS